MKTAILLPFISIALASVVTRSPASSRSHLTERKSFSADKDNGKSNSQWDTIPLNTVLYWITNLFPFNVLVEDAGDLTTRAESVLASLVGIPTTQNTVVDGQCATITIIFARGTSEVGNVGIIVGPESFDAVAARLNIDATLAVQGVEYAASIPGFLQGGDPAGSQQM